jgi:antitoxin (DNA-binding transcriptional repressor) of toxin-antitoxin stability system
MITLNIDEIQQDLSAFIKLIQEGNSLIITQADQPIAEIKPIIKQPEKQRRPISLCEGEFIVPDNFNDPLPEEIISNRLTTFQPINTSIRIK